MVAEVNLYRDEESQEHDPFQMTEPVCFEALLNFYFYIVIYFGELGIDVVRYPYLTAYLDTLILLLASFSNYSRSSLVSIY